MKKAILTLKESTYSTDINENIPKGTKFISVSFDAGNEGFGYPADSEEQVKKIIRETIERYKNFYKIQIIDLRIKDKIEKQMTLWK